MKNESKSSALAAGNAAFREGNFPRAVALYEKAVLENPELQDLIDINLTIGRRRCAADANTPTESVGHTVAQLTGVTNPAGLSEVDLGYTSDDHRIIASSGLFNQAYYLENYEDVAGSGVDPLEHYCNHGWKEQRNPNKEFNTHYYLGMNPDVAQAMVNPFAHWIQYGQFEQRKTSKVEVDPHYDPSAHQPTLIFISHEASQTGAPAVLLSLMRWLKKNTSIKFSIIIGAQGIWNKRFEEIAPCFYLDDAHKGGLTAELRDFCGSNVQSVYVNTIASGNYAEHLKYLGAEFITHVHEMENVFEIFETQFSALSKICNKYIAVSPGSIESLKKRNIKQHEISFLKPFIEPFEFYRKGTQNKHRKTVIFGCGAVETRKGFDLFCEVGLALLQKGDTQFKMIWIGSAEGKDLDPLKEVSSRHLSEFIEWIGPRDNPREYFASGDIFLLPSREDPYPLVCMEAAEAGMPVVCFGSEAGGMHTFVENDAGIVVDYLDIDGMASAIHFLMKDVSTRRQMGKCAREKVIQRHYVDKVAQQIVSLLPASVHQLGSSVELYLKKIDSAKIISFDIFDTLLTRKLRDPEVVFDVIEYNLTNHQPASLPLLKERMDTAGLVLGRQLGERDDISIDEIYQEMSFFRDSNTEKEVELSVCVAHPLGKKLYQYAQAQGKEIYIASDMYLDEHTIESILKNCGYSHWDKLFLSSTLGKKKETGNLYKEMIDFSKGSGHLPSEIFHIGDNWEGDVRQARLSGIETKRFTPIGERSRKLFKLPLNSKKKLSQKGRIWNSYCEQQTDLWHQDMPSASSDFYTQLGFEVTGPLACMMAMYVKSQAKKSHIHQIVFMARDGRIIKKAFDALYSQDILEGHVRSDYLHLSRATVIPATFQNPLTSNDIAFILDGLHLQEKPVQYFLNKAGISAQDPGVKEVVLRHFSSIEHLPNWDDYITLSRIFTELSSLVYAANSRNREHLESYLKDNDILHSKSVLFVDVGWLLNIQSRIESFLANIGSTTLVKGCYVGSRERVSKNSYHSGLLFEQGDPYVYTDFIEKNTTLFEVLFSAPEPSAKGLTNDPDRNQTTVAFKKITNPIPKEFVAAQKIHFGAEEFIARFRLARESFFPEIISRDYFFQLFKSLTASENPIVKATLGNFEVSLGGDHEFVITQALIKNNDPYTNYYLKEKSDFFEPIKFSSHDDQPNILIFTSAGLDNGSTRYRSIHLAQSLAGSGISCVVAHAATSHDKAAELIAQADTVIFQRCFMAQGNIAYIYAKAREENKRCISDIDDLVFPKFVPTIGSVAGGEWDINQATFVAESYDNFIKKMDGCIVSTPALRAHIALEYKIPCEVYRNKVLPFVAKESSPPPAQVKLVYASGTYSHRQDFEIIEDSLYRFLAKTPSCQLSILGAAQVSERILALTNVASYPILGYQDMLSFIEAHDLLLVPLVDNIFNRAKSTVKFIEAGSVSVPVLASEVGEFKASIKHKVNGYLAKNATDWSHLLEQLIQNPNRLSSVGSQAQQTVLKRYTTDQCELRQKFLFGTSKPKRNTIPLMEKIN